ncbi:hypothetical protein EVAR_27734_1 [Eumeta japonica]|uniref:Endonuclease/exonuclease/phosphatase domain-containing protein n=1 Tax=Eumeta variegata TaxID=151549 RepID=A0A4C1VCZ8_EUMVA|nr:hypothetical protein EVAR_27734_1 [Eumeta japonica]
MRTLGVRVGSAEEEISIFACYRPLGSPLHVQNVHTLLNGSAPTLIAGDLNAKHKTWGSRSVNRAERCLMEDAESRGYKVPTCSMFIHPETPTHVPTDPRHRADVLDIVLSHKVTWTYTYRSGLRYEYPTSPYPDNSWSRSAAFTTATNATMDGLDSLPKISRDITFEIAYGISKGCGGSRQYTGEQDKGGPTKCYGFPTITPRRSISSPQGKNTAEEKTPQILNPHSLP